MYNLSAVTAALHGLVGFRQVNDKDIPPIDEDLTTSRSGLWIDKAHPLLTAPILTNAATGLANFITDGTDPLSYLIRNTLDDSVSAVLSALRTRKLLRYEAQTLLATTPLYEGEGSISDLISKAGRFVGLEIITNDPQLAVHVSRLGLQLTGASDVLIFAFDSNNDQVDDAAPINYTGAGRMQWFDVNLTLSSANRYVIGYTEDDLEPGVQAVRRNKEIGYVACAGCSPQNANLINRWSPFVKVNAVRQDNHGDPYDTIKEQNYGLNLAISVGCDLAPTIISQQQSMAEAIQQQAVVKLLSELAYSTLITTVEQQVRKNAMFALQNGETAKLERLLDALDIDFSGLSPRCLPKIGELNLAKRQTIFNRR